MPFEEIATEASAALAAPQDRFRSALSNTVESVRTLLEDARAAAGGRLDRLAAGFGAFGGTYLDLDRMAAIIDTGPAVDPAVLAVVERAYQVLEDVTDRPAYTATVARGGSLQETVGAALANVGRAIGAARIVELARHDRYRPSEHEPYLDAFPFGLWSQAERRLAPPLVIGVAGADLRPAALAEYLDGGVKLVLIVEPPATPAPLVRLITPGVFVAQTADLAVINRLAAWEGPGVVAITPDGTAEFVHDPSGGAALGGRLTVTSQPTGGGLHRVGPFTVTQQRDELQQLSDLAAAKTGLVASAEPAEAGKAAEDPVGKLAAWLLAQADPANDADKNSPRG